MDFIPSIRKMVPPDSRQQYTRRRDLPTGPSQQSRAIGMKNSLIDFLNHGILPFSGRTSELERIVAFWRDTVHAPGLRTLLVSGEAGIGKSRLIEEAIGLVMNQGGAVAQVRMYPGAANAPAPLLAHALWNSGAGRRLLQREPEPTLTSVAAALRRMCRLRPTLLVIEDAHLLAGDAVSEAASLLAMMADETLSIVCSTRPSNAVTRAMLEPYIVEECMLPGLDDDAIINLWHSLFDADAALEVAHAVRETTLGNPLAVRSALRGAMASGALARQPDTGNWHATVGADVFVTILRHYVGLLGEGMAAHLTAVEREAASTLACLGEVFAHETATAAIDNAAQLLESLAFKGIITTASTLRPPISGEAGKAPLLRFAHTLLHQQFADQRLLNISRIAAIIANRLPLYSIFPFTFLAEQIATTTLPDTLRELLIEELLAVAGRLDASRDWELAITAWRAAQAVYISQGHTIVRENRAPIPVRLAVQQLGLLRRENHTDSYAHLVEQALALTAQPDSPQVAAERLHILRHHLWVIFRRQPQTFAMGWEEVDTLLQNFPELTASEAYLLLLRDLVQLSVSLANIPLVRQAEQRIQEAIHSPLATEATRNIALRQIYVHLLVIFETQEELQRRMEMLPKIERALDAPNLSFEMAKARLYEETGRYRMLLEILDRILPRIHDLGMAVSEQSGQMMAIAADCALGKSMTDIIEAGTYLCNNATTDAAQRLSGEVGIRLACMALLRGEVSAARTVITQFLKGRSPWPMLDLLIALSDNETDVAFTIAMKGAHGSSTITSFVQAVNAENEDAAAEAFRTFVQTPVLRITDILSIHAMLDLVQMHREHSAVQVVVHHAHQELSQLLRECLEWLHERGLWSMILPLLQRHGELLPSSEVKSWHRRYTQKADEETIVHLALPQQVELRMTGTIELRTAGGDVVHLRTGRLRTLLGVLVADLIIENRLTLREFRELVTGETETDQARKGTNLVIHRLREAIGHDAISTSPSGADQTAETPQLNTERVHVDLLDAWHHLKNARDGLQHLLPMKASSELLAALRILHNEVSFPGLYDDFFEAVREDLEVQLRSIIMDTSRLLLQEGDLAMAAEVLHHGADALPGDDELSEMLRETLLRDGKHVEAGRV